MTDHTPTLRRRAWIAILMTGVLQACSQPPKPVPGARVYAADVNGGAKICEVARVKPVGGQVTETGIKVGNDGGWCGLSVRQPDSKPYGAGLLASRPAHGSILIHQVGDDTRIDYTPDRTFTGSDSFSVQLVPGDATVHIAVTVAPPEPAAKG